MKTVLILLSLIAATQANAIINLFMEEWNTFKLQYGKVYQSSVEEMLRMKIFVENKRKIAKHNAKYERGQVSYQLGLNRFGDMFPHEFNEIMNGYNHSLQVDLGNSLGNKGATFIEPANVEIPSSVDWRKKGAVTEVKDQGQCGSCWAFSATGALEGQHFRKTGVLVSLSEQNLIDCSFAYGNNGCDGGYAHKAFGYIMSNGGIDTEDSYPYEGQVYKCRYDASHKGADEKGFSMLRNGDETLLMNTVATVGPISAAIDASHDSFQLYKTGIYFEPECSSEYLNRYVLVVGYGTTASGEDYWLVKNSFGSEWGESGYIRMARNHNNNCGIATRLDYPTV